MGFLIDYIQAFSEIVNSFSITWDSRCSQFLMLLHEYHSFSCVLSGLFVAQTDILHRMAGSCWKVVESQLHMIHGIPDIHAPIIRSDFANVYHGPTAISFL